MIKTKLSCESCCWWIKGAIYPGARDEQHIGFCMQHKTPFLETGVCGDHLEAGVKYTNDNGFQPMSWVEYCAHFA